MVDMRTYISLSRYTHKTCAFSLISFIEPIIIPTNKFDAVILARTLAQLRFQSHYFPCIKQSERENVYVCITVFTWIHTFVKVTLTQITFETGFCCGFANWKSVNTQSFIPNLIVHTSFMRKTPYSKLSHKLIMFRSFFLLLLLFDLISQCIIRSRFLSSVSIRYVLTLKRFDWKPNYAFTPFYSFYFVSFTYRLVAFNCAARRWTTVPILFVSICIRF